MGSNWTSIRLGDVCTKIGSGATPRGGKDAYRGGNVALIRSQNIYNDHFAHDGIVYIDDAQAHALRNVSVHAEDVLLNITGDSVARCCQVSKDALPARVNQHVAIIRTQPDALDARFLRYVLVSPSMQHHLLALASAGATRNALTKAMIESLSIRAPHIEEQRAIAHILGTLDDKIELNRQQNQALEAMARALFKAWFVDFDGVSSEDMKESELGSIPRGWRIGKFEELLVLQRGFDLPTKSRVAGDFPVIAAGGVNGTHHEAMVKGPGVVTGRSGVLGNVYFELDDFWPLNTTLWVKEFRIAKPCYAYELLRAFDFKTFNSGSAVPSLNRNHIHHLLQIIPPAEIVNAFEKEVMPLRQRMDSNERQSRTLAQLRDTLLPKLISGELRVTPQVLP